MVAKVNELKAKYIEVKSELDTLSMDLNKKMDELNLAVIKFEPTGSKPNHKSNIQ